MTIEHHDFLIGSSFFHADDGRDIVPECSCGWEGERQDSAERAQEAWEDHCEVVFMEATGG